jgi:hypothetical protein
MTSEGFGEMFEGAFTDICGQKILFILMGGRAESLACADQGARTPIGMNRNVNTLFICWMFSPNCCFFPQVPGNSDISQCLFIAGGGKIDHEISAGTQGTFWLTTGGFQKYLQYRRNQEKVFYTLLCM